MDFGGAVTVPLWTVALIPVGWAVIAYLSYRLNLAMWERGAFDRGIHRAVETGAPVLVEGVAEAISSRLNGAVGGMMGSAAKDGKALDAALGRDILAQNPVLADVLASQLPDVYKLVTQKPWLAEAALRRVEPMLAPLVAKLQGAQAAAAGTFTPAAAEAANGLTWK